MGSLTASLEDLKRAQAKLITDKEALDLALAKARDEIDATTEAARLAAAQREALEALLADLRAKSSTDTYSAWSAVASGTPTGTVTPPPTWDSTKYLVSYDHRDVMMGEGVGTPNFNDYWTQQGWARDNPSSDEWAIANAARDDRLDRVISAWENQQHPTAFRLACKPRLIITGKPGIIDDATMDGWWVTTDRKVQAVLDVAISGSTGSLNRDSVWSAFGNSLNRTYRGYNVYDLVFFSVAHESNGYWNATGLYMGVQDDFIGRPEFVNAQNSVYGSEMAAALRRIGATGAMDDHHRLYCEHVIDLITTACPNAILGMTPASAASSSPTGDLVGNLGYGWIDAAFPDRALDFMAPTHYNRGGSVTYYDGSGDVDDWTNYAAGDDFLAANQDFTNTKSGCPFGLTEFGAGYALPGVQVPGEGGSPTDDANAAYLERILEHELIDAVGKSENGLCFVQHWNFLNWVNGGDGGLAGQSFNILEGCWGLAPDGFQFSGTGRPSFSGAASTAAYPKSLAYMQSQFSI